MIEQVKPVYVLDEARKKWNLDPKNKVVGIFAGSRFYHVKVSLPFYLKVADEIRSQMPDTDFLLGVSPFLTIENIRECIKTYSYSVEGTSGELIAEDNGNLIIKTKNQTEIKILKGYQYDMINLSDIVLTIPGTNTAEIGVMGKPMVVGITWKAKIPRGGLTGFLSSILFIDSLKKYIFQMYIRRIKYTSLPNQMAQKEVVPEIIVEKKSDIISDKVVELLRDDKKRSEISDELKRVFKSTNASEKMVDLILKSFAVKPFDWLNRSIFSIKLREFMFKWRGYLFIPFAMFVLFTAKPTIFSLIAGSAVAVLGELLRIWGVGYAGSTTRRDKVIAPEIVTGGPFAHLKNPLYLGNFITAFGFCIMALGKSTASDSVFLFMLCIIYYAAIYNLIIPLEEAYLYRTFGDLYLRYSKLVPKIIPQIKPYNERNGRFEWREIINTEIHTIILFFAVFAVMIYKYIKL